MLMIDIKDLHFSYPGTRNTVYKGLSLHLEPGHIYGLLGKNGTGKSTLLYMISGMLCPTQGSVRTFGHEARERHSAMLRDIFLVPEEYNMPNVSLSEYISLLRDLYPNFSVKTFRQCLSDFEMPTEPKLKELSMGQKKKVYMSVALAAGTRLILMDEPTNGLDIPSKALFRKVIARNMGDEQTLIILTHQVHDVETLIDHVVIIDHDGLQLNASIADISEHYVFETRQAGDMQGDELYAEPSLQGNLVVAPRKAGDAETSVNLELLFSAVAHSLEPLLPLNGASDESTDVATHKDGLTWSGFKKGLKWQYTNHWREAVRQFGIYFGVCFAIPMMSVLQGKGTMSSDFFGLMSIVACLATVFLTGTMFLKDIKTRQQCISMLTQPISNIEKFISRHLWVVGSTLASTLGGLVVAYILQYLVVMVAYPTAIEEPFLTPFTIDTGYSQLTLALSLLLLHSIYILGGVYFRKLSWLWVTLILVFGSVVTTTAVTYIAAKTIETLLDGGTYRMEFLISFDSAVWLLHIGTVLLSALFYWLAYRVYKRLQVINNRYHN